MMARRDEPACQHPGGGPPGPYSSFSGVIGRSRTRRPVAWKTALATAAATPVMGSSPRPRAPSGLMCRSGRLGVQHAPHVEDVDDARHPDAGEVRASFTAATMLG
jgi:hypothetical protein